VKPPTGVAMPHPADSDRLVADDQVFSIPPWFERATRSLGEIAGCR
jgi:hypothetical protein